MVVPPDRMVVHVVGVMGGYVEGVVPFYLYLPFLFFICI